MVRWQPGARERLQAAALELYVSRGFEETTVTEIAESVGLTERTFFRHFADKREVLFVGQDVLQRCFENGVADAPSGAPALELVMAALDGAAGYFPADKRPYSRSRQAVIAANPALQERELLKLAGLAVEVAAALRARGVAEPTATIAAELGITVFSVAFVQWIGEAEERSFAELTREGLAALVDLTQAAGQPASTAAAASSASNAELSRRS